MIGSKNLSKYTVILVLMGMWLLLSKIIEQLIFEWYKPFVWWPMKDVGSLFTMTTSAETTQDFTGQNIELMSSFIQSWFSTKWLLFVPDCQKSIMWSAIFNNRMSGWCAQKPLECQKCFKHWFYRTVTETTLKNNKKSSNENDPDT